MYDDKPESDSYNFYDDEEAFNSGFDDFEDSRGSRFDDRPSKWETESERKKREKIESLKKK